MGVIFTEIKPDDGGVCLYINIMHYKPQLGIWLS